MEPKLSAPSSGPEQSPANYEQRLEHAPSPSTPERLLEQGAERFETRSELPAATTAAPILPPPLVVSLPSPTVTSDDATLTDTSAPIVAADEDLIEKEWVDKAKKIILQTKDDPYRREQEVGQLQADYLRKRYGKELGASQ
ncbi:MAG: hypothetical protein ACHQTE_00180 [Candidatus Saccharimonadales bacterium]